MLRWKKICEPKKKVTILLYANAWEQMVIPVDFDLTFQLIDASQSAFFEMFDDVFIVPRFFEQSNFYYPIFIQQIFSLLLRVM